MFIYLIVNHVTGKYYVGQHKGDNLKKYLQQKLSQAWYELKRGRGGSSYLFRSMRKHPKEAWSIHALLSDIQTRVELDQYEKDFITFLKSQDPRYGYNICRGGEGFSGPHSLATRRKIANASRKMWRRSEIRENFSKKMLGKNHHSPEGIESIRQARCGTNASPQTIEKLRNSHIGIASSRRKSVLCVDTNELFPSLKHVVIRFGGCTTSLSRAIKCGYTFFGKRFEYAR